MLNWAQAFLRSRKNPANDFLDWHLLNIDVGHRNFIEQSFADGDDAIAFYFQLDAAGALLDDFAERKKRIRSGHRLTPLAAQAPAARQGLTSFACRDRLNDT